MKEIWCVGELLIDMVAKKPNEALKDSDELLVKEGGAPANVAVAIQRLGGRAKFIGKVGKDPFGTKLIDTLQKEKVNISNLIQSNDYFTTLAFVSLFDNGERDFIFSRGADEQLTKEEIDFTGVNDVIFHFGSATALLGGPLKEAYSFAYKLAYERDLFVSFDPNYREDLWKGRENDFIQLCLDYIPYSDLVKVSEEELQFITGQKDIEAGAQKLIEKGTKIVLVTLGSKGSLLCTENFQETIKTIKVKAVDATGAGDACIGAVLYQISKEENPLELYKDESKLKKMVAFANKVGAHATTQYGAIKSLPFMDDIKQK